MKRNKNIDFPLPVIKMFLSLYVKALASRTSTAFTPSYVMSTSSSVSCNSQGLRLCFLLDAVFLQWRVYLFPSSFNLQFKCLPLKKTKPKSVRLKYYDFHCRFL
jgi:hypothetical protein